MHVCRHHACMQNWTIKTEGSSVSPESCFVPNNFDIVGSFPLYSQTLQFGGDTERAPPSHDGGCAVCLYSLYVVHTWSLIQHVAHLILVSFPAVRTYLVPRPTPENEQTMVSADERQQEACRRRQAFATANVFGMDYQQDSW